MTPRRHSRAGFSLIELVVVLVVLGIVLGALVVATTTMQRQLGEQRRRADAAEALLGAETFLSNLLQGAEANPFRVNAAGGFRYLDPQPTGATSIANYSWFTGESALAFDGIRVFSDFNPGDGQWDDPFEDVLVLVQNGALQVTWLTTAGGTSRTDVIASPITGLRISYYSVLRQPINDATSLSVARQVRFRLTTSVRIGGRDVTLTRDRWVYLRNR